MQILSAALAFAITMLILSMVTNVMVETIHRIWGMRTVGLRLMLGHLFDRVVAPMLGQPDAAALAARREEFLDLMTVNRAPAGTAYRGDTTRQSDGTSVDEGEEGLLRWPWRGRRLDGLSVDNFMSRLGGSSFSDEIRALGNGTAAEVDQILADIGQKFIDFGDEASVFFQRRARLLAVVVSVLVAWFMYVQPFEIFSTFINDPKVATNVIAMQEAVTKEFEDWQAKQLADKLEKVAAAKLALEKATGDQTQPGTDTTSEQGDGTAGTDAGATGDQGTADSDAGSGTDQGAGAGDAVATDEIAKLEQDLEDAEGEVDKALQYAADSLDKLKDAGVPIGWSKDRMQAAGFKWWDLTLFQVPVPVSQKGAATAFWLILGGFLVGLGGPFWYDMVKSLSAIRSVMGSGSAGADATGATTGNPVTTATATLPKTAIEHFNVSAAGRDAAMGSGVNEQDDELAVG